MKFNRIVTTKNIYSSTGRLLVEKGLAGTIVATNQGFVDVLFDDGPGFVELSGCKQRMQSIPFLHTAQDPAQIVEQQKLMDQAEKLAKAFADNIKEWSTPSEFDAIRKNNAKLPANICAAQSYMDSNLAMEDAFKRTIGREPEIYDGDANQSNHLMLWNLAREIAKVKYLTCTEEN